jgi:hypothetical protein
VDPGELSSLKGKAVVGVFLVEGDYHLVGLSSSEGSTIGTLLEPPFKTSRNFSSWCFIYRLFAKSISSSVLQVLVV